MMLFQQLKPSTLIPTVKEERTLCPMVSYYVRTYTRSLTLARSRSTWIRCLCWLAQASQELSMRPLRDAHFTSLVTHWQDPIRLLDRKSTRLNSSHANISYAVFCLKT